MQLFYLFYKIPTKYSPLTPLYQNQRPKIIYPVTRKPDDRCVFFAVQGACWSLSQSLIVMLIKLGLSHEQSRCGIACLEWEGGMKQI